MQLYIKILEFSQEQAHGCFCLGDEGETLIPFSMPISAYEQAVQNGVLQVTEHTHKLVQGPPIIESTLFFFQPFETI